MREMSRSRSGFYNAIEYIGPRPQKPKKPNFFGGWVIIAFALAAVVFFVKPMVSSVLAAQKAPANAQSEMRIQELESTGNFSDKLAAEALKYASKSFIYDDAYFKIAYPKGDVPAGKGIAADVVLRCYQKLGIDLQEKVHEDMQSNYRLYPQLWTASEPDTNIDHRRVPNLQHFFGRKGVSLKADRNPANYKPGDIVIWALANAETHIGIVVPAPAGENSALWVVHHPSGGGVKWEDALFSYQILGHFSYLAE